MRLSKTMRTVLCAAVVVALAGGCGDPEPERTGTLSSDVRDMDPRKVCTELSDDVVAAAGLDPSTKDVQVYEDESDSMYSCTWQPKDHPASLIPVGLVFIPNHMLDELRDDDQLGARRETTINGRPGLFFWDNGCYANFEAEEGLFQVYVSGNDRDLDGDVCALAARYAAALEPHLPT